MNPKLFIFLLIFLTKIVFSSSVQISGLVRDKENGEVLIGANVWQKGTQKGVITDKRGFFNIWVNIPCTISFSYVGYETFDMVINNEDLTFTEVFLNSNINLGEVVIVSERENKFEAIRLTSKELKLTPSLSGKPDVLKALQLTPGIQTQSEGLSLMMVRGGEPGQNLYLIDNVPLIYVNHLGGFMSVFNPDIINTVDLFKGNFPPKFGGKLSSIVDITQREGDYAKHQGSFSIGITDATFTFEGPLLNSEVSYIFSARKTFFDPAIALFTSLSDHNNSIMSYGFHDFNAKVTWKKGAKNLISFNIYQGDDYLNFWSKPEYNPENETSHALQVWGNWLASIRWNSVINENLYTENILSYNRYRNTNKQNWGYEKDTIKLSSENENRSSVEDFSLKSFWKTSLSRLWELEFGGQLSYFVHEPNFIFNSLSTASEISNLKTSVEGSLFVDNNISISEIVKIKPSLRVVSYLIEDYTNLYIEPRMSLTFNFKHGHSFNLNYMKVSQTSHLFFTQSNLIKKEIWLPATFSLPPQVSNQFSVSWGGNFLNKLFKTELCIYYKEMKNLTMLKEGYENLYGLTDIENKIESDGTGTAYGLELSITKQKGKWRGAISYCWSNAFRQYGQINNNKTFEYDFNRPHNFNLSIVHEFSKAWSANVLWLFQSGTPYTPAFGKQYTYNSYTGEFDEIGLVIGEKNSSRLQPYHRLDLSVNYEKTTKRGNHALWTFSIYNAYNRVNPYNYYYDNDYDRQNIMQPGKPLRLFKIGLFSIIPNISYKVYFDYSKEKPKKERKKTNWLYLTD
jgi:hypothetical protein